jgi:hypothetical protein
MYRVGRAIVPAGVSDRRKILTADGHERLSHEIVDIISYLFRKEV